MLAPAPPQYLAGMNTRLSRRPGLVALVLLLTSAGSGCNLVQSAAEVPGKVTGAVLPGDKGKKRPSPEELQVDLMSLCDSAIARIDQASQELIASLKDPKERIRASEWRLQSMRGLLNVASGPDPVRGLLDLIVALTAARIAHEGHWLAKWGEADRPLYEAIQGIEADAWSLCERFLGKEDAKQVREAISAWAAKHPELGSAKRVSPPAFAQVLDELSKSGAPASSSLLGALSLDPLSGLEPAAQQMALARRFLERTLYYFQRAPRLISEEVELELMKAQQQPEWQQALADSQRISLAAESISATAAGLPAALGAEVSAQRKGLIADLESAQAPLHATLSEARETLEAGERMSSSLTQTLQALGSFVDKVDSEPPAPAPGAPPPVPGKPFDVTDYGAAAAQIGSMAKELAGLIAELEGSLPEVERTVDAAAARGEATLDRAFRLGLVLGLVLIAAAAGAALFVRRMGKRPAAA